MTDEETQDFVTKFAAARAARDSEGFLALWHPDGVVFSPLTNRLIAGNELQKQSAPDLVCELLDWTTRGDVVIIEWQCTRLIAGRRFDFRGVDKLRLKAGKIIEERVYMDTAPLRAARTGGVPEPLLEL
jgi:ketosteroid isomerase-like protein